MKIVLGLVIIVIFALLGYFLGLRYKDRRVFFEDFYKFNNNYLKSVSFSNDSLKSVINSIDDKGDFYKTALQKIYGGNDSKHFPYLKQDEKIIDEYFSGIGQGDAFNEKRGALKFDEILKDKKKKCEEDEKKYRPLFIKLGLLFGIIVFILII